MSIKNREQVLSFLSEHKAELQKTFGVTRLGLVGSCARNEAGPLSDIDLIVSLQSDNSFRSFFGLLHYLQDNLDKRIDLATEESLKPLVKESIMRDVHYV